MRILKKLTYTAVLACSVMLFNGCSKEDSLGESRLDTTEPVRNELDQWIFDTYLLPYNINASYKWNQNKVDNNRYLYPPTLEKVKPALDIVEKIWLRTYNEVAGPDFVKIRAPRELLLIGGVNLNTTGTVTLGLAEAGMRITFFETDKVDPSSLDNVRMFVHTIQHEYVHILNQTDPFDTKSYGKITPSGYVQDWYEYSDEDSRELGFITNYSRSNVEEDFAEMASFMLVYTKVEYEAILASIVDKTAVAKIRAKEAIVVKYYRDAFGIDFYKLREVAEVNTMKVVNEYN